jgi:hypothetical protein
MSNDRPFSPKAVEAAKAAKKRHREDLMRYPNVVGVGVGFKVKRGRRVRTLAIRVYVHVKVPLSKLKRSQRLPRSIDGIPVDVIVRKPVYYLFDPTNPSPRHAARQGVLFGGISIGLAGGNTGTLGGSFFDNSTLMDVMLTNWHVVCNEDNCSVGTILQPSAFDNDELHRVVGKILRTRVAPAIDAAVLSLDGSALLERRVLDMGEIGGPVPSEIGMTVIKVGRTSGLTRGTITDVAADFKSCNADGENCHDHADQIQFDGGGGMVQAGDSGSLLLDGAGNVVGLVFAASEDGDVGNACHIQDVLNLMNVNLTSGMTQQELIAATHALDA